MIASLSLRARAPFRKVDDWLMKRYPALWLARPHTRLPPLVVGLMCTALLSKLCGALLWAEKGSPAVVVSCYVVWMVVLEVKSSDDIRFADLLLRGEQSPRIERAALAVRFIAVLLALEIPTVALSEYKGVFFETDVRAIVMVSFSDVVDMAIRSVARAAQSAEATIRSMPFVDAELFQELYIALAISVAAVKSTSQRFRGYFVESAPAVLVLLSILAMPLFFIAANFWRAFYASFAISLIASMRKRTLPFLALLLLIPAALVLACSALSRSLFAGRSLGVPLSLFAVVVVHLLFPAFQRHCRRVVLDPYWAEVLRKKSP